MIVFKEIMKLRLRIELANGRKETDNNSAFPAGAYLSKDLHTVIGFLQSERYKSYIRAGRGLTLRSTW